MWVWLVGLTIDVTVGLILLAVRTAVVKLQCVLYDEAELQSSIIWLKFKNFPLTL
jgi:hypothetical protein